MNRHHFWTTASPEQRQAQAREAARQLDPDDLWALTEVFFQTEGREVSHHTLHTYRMGVMQLLRYLVETQKDLITLPEMQAYVEWLQQKGLSPITVHSRLGAAKHLGRALAWAGVDTALAVSRTRLPKVLKQNRRPYTGAEINALLAHATAEERLVVLLGVETGLKAGEMSALRRGDVNLQVRPPSLYLMRGEELKGSVVVTPPLEQALLTWLQVKPANTEKLFSGKGAEYIEDRLRSLCTRAGVVYGGIGIEGLRLTAGARFYKNNRSEELLMSFLRIKHKRNVQQYIDAARQLE